MNRKKLLCAAVSLAMAFGLTACADTAITAPGSESPAEPAPAISAEQSAQPETSEVVESPEAPEETSQPIEEPTETPAADETDGDNMSKYTSGYIAPGREVVIFDADVAADSDSITLPYFNLMSSDSDKANEEISDLYDRLSKAGLSASYVWSRSDTMASAVVLADEVYTYNFEISTGRRINGDQALEKAGGDWTKVLAAYNDQCRAYYAMCDRAYDTGLDAEELADTAFKDFEEQISDGSLGVYPDYQGKVTFFTKRYDPETGEDKTAAFLYSDSALIRALYNTPKEAVCAVIDQPQGWDAQDPLFECNINVPEGEVTQTVMFVAVTDGTVISVNGCKYDEDTGEFSKTSDYVNALEMKAGDTVIVNGWRAETIPTVMITVENSGRQAVYYLQTNGRWGDMPVEYPAAE